MRFPLGYGFAKAPVLMTVLLAGFVLLVGLVLYAAGMLAVYAVHAVVWLLVTLWMVLPPEAIAILAGVIAGGIPAYLSYRFWRSQL